MELHRIKTALVIQSQYTPIVC